MDQILEFLNGDIAGMIATFFIIAYGVLKVGKIIVGMTKTTKDDDFWAKLEQLIKKLDPNSEVVGELKTAKKSTLGERFWNAI